MSKQDQTTTPEDLQKILNEISMPDALDCSDIQTQLTKLKLEIAELKEDLQMKKKLLDIQKNTNQTLDSQQKMLRERGVAYEQRIRILQAQLRDRVTPYQSKIKALQSQLKEKNQIIRSSSNSEDNNDKIFSLENKIADLQKQLDDERKKCKQSELRMGDQKIKRLQVETKLQSLNSDFKHLQRQNNTLKRSIEQNNTCSRQLDELRHQIEQRNSNLKKTQMEKQTLKAEIEQLHSKLASATTSKNQVIIKQVIRQSDNTQELAKLNNANKKLDDQLQVAKREKVASQKQLNTLRYDLNEARRRQEGIRTRYRQLEDQVTRLRRGANSAVQPSEPMSEVFGLPDSIGQQSIKIKKKQQYDLDAQQLNEDRRVRIVYVHKKMVESLLNHFNSISQQEKIPFLNILTCWSEEQQQKVQRSISELEQPDFVQ